ncbi:MAG TPA: cytochrome c biogenesis protein CcsA [Pseudacidobacterium sp.]|nr:cytochrome c biogenesis protein CcsA [Pseudacidobacterium sp.]
MFLLWLRVAAALYGLASVSALPAVLGDRPRWQKASLVLAIAGWFYHVVAMVEILVAAHRWMPVGMHEVQSTLSLLIVAAFLLIWLRYRAISFSVFALPLAFFLLLMPSFGPDRYTFSSPLVRSGWIYIHIALLLAAYAALIFSLLASLLYLVQERRLKNKRTPGFLNWLPPLDTMDQIAQKTLVLGFYCMTGGLLIGSFIAQEHVGPTYFLDPKVVLSFVMWVLYIVMVFVQRSTGLRGRRAAYLSSAVFLVMLCVWAANLFSSVHRYTTP